MRHKSTSVTIQNNCGYDILKYVPSGAISVVVYKICLESEVVELFFSYCHKDEDYRNEMEVHLSLLKRQGVISTWHDRRIVVGSEIDADINTHLESANVIVLLVSPYFLASDYCYEKEMARAMERHNTGEAVVIPVILHPCDWHGAPFGKLLATPTDGKPISMYANQHEAFAIISKHIREAVESISVSHISTPQLQPKPSLSVPHDNSVRSSNLRVKRPFSDHEKDEFIDASFEYVARYFEGSLKELESRYSHLQAKFRHVDNNRFTASLYSNRERSAQCTLWLGGHSFQSKGIYYSNTETSSDNSYNEQMSVGDDGYSLHLKPLGMSFIQTNSNELSQEGAAEYFWTIFIQHLQR
ncbi:toll/interleukin-1 receptor domain-containing protein [Vibrio parahaemolyticus]|nr:toll/interleukin-1 receptor domain-containing protein [Vibrio parahaemolyticus]MCC3813652.1 toll/interleukin-1 receptor domain-containing protein [Vibrio parahaemolyticus]